MSTQVDDFLERVEAAVGSDAAPAERIACAAAVLHEQAADSDELEPLLPVLSSHFATTDAMPAKARRRAGAFYTPAELVAFMLDHTLDPWMETPARGLPTVLDPACGSGRFLLAAGARLAIAHRQRFGGSESAAWRGIGPKLIGFDSDPLATAWLSGRISALAGGDPEAAIGVHTIDALHDDALPAHSADIIVGNPPFGTPLRRRTDAESLRRRAAVLAGAPIGPYADIASIFLLLAGKSLRSGGRMTLVQPLSVLAARDTQSIRDAVLKDCEPTFGWSTNARIFDAQVHVCAVGFYKRLIGDPAPVRRFGDLPPTEYTPSRRPGIGHSWAALASPACSVPDPPPFEQLGTLGDIAHATADFRDQYYGLLPALVETPDPIPSGVAPVVTTGGLDVAQCLWGERAMRLHKQSWHRPGVTLSSLEPSMQDWAASRLVPKVMLPTQTRILEPVLDIDGQWLPSVPIISVTAAAERLSEVAALLACPLVSLLALHRYLGTARSPSAIKLAARDVLALPAPPHQELWHRAATAFTAATHAGDDASRKASLCESARLMHQAFGLGEEVSESILAWWLQRRH
ncbi:MAG: N-6 DNA methylase [Phycisphaerales bacterium]|jgi:hypothetical protein|nr:N-6 DNA methylase [Phycisphaerales bacterium]